MECIHFNFYQFFLSRASCLNCWIIESCSLTLLLKLHTQRQNPKQTTPCLIKLYAVIFGSSKTPVLVLSYHSQLGKPSPPMVCQHTLLFYNRAANQLNYMKFLISTGQKFGHKNHKTDSLHLN